MKSGSSSLLTDLIVGVIGAILGGFLGGFLFGLLGLFRHWPRREPRHRHGGGQRADRGVEVLQEVVQGHGKCELMTAGD